MATITLLCPLVKMSFDLADVEYSYMDLQTVAITHELATKTALKASKEHLLTTAVTRREV